jgi:hypothetical protein
MKDMAEFTQRYSSEHPPTDLWRAINTPLDPDLATLVYDGVDIAYEELTREGQIGLGSTVRYFPTDEVIERTPPVYRRFIPNDVDYYVCRMSDTDYGLRHEVLMSGKAEGSVTRTVEVDGDTSIGVVEASLTLNGLGNRFDNQIHRALQHVFGSSTENMLELVPEILKA